MFLLWLVFRGAKWDAVAESIRGASVGWLIVVQFVYLASFILRARRWGYLARSSTSASFRSLFNATQIGMLGNYVLPLRLGEVIRAVVFSRLAPCPFPRALALGGLDRALDLIMLILVMLFTVLVFPASEGGALPAEAFNTPEPIELSPGLIQAGCVGTATVLAGVLAVFVLLFVNQALVLRISRRLLTPVSEGLAARVCNLLEQFAQGLRVFRSVGDMLRALFYSLITWVCYVLALLGMLKAFGVAGPWYTVFVLQSLLAVAISVPGAPAFVGQFHLPIVLTLALLVPDMSMNEAKAIAIVTHIANVFPIAAVGVFCLWWEKLGLLQLSKESVRARDEME